MEIIIAPLVLFYFAYDEGEKSFLPIIAFNTTKSKMKKSTIAVRLQHSELFEKYVQKHSKYFLISELIEVQIIEEGFMSHWISNKLTFFIILALIIQCCFPISF